MLDPYGVVCMFNKSSCNLMNKMKHTEVILCPVCLLNDSRVTDSLNYFEKHAFH